MTLILPQISSGLARNPYTLESPNFVQNKTLTYKTNTDIAFNPDGTKMFITTISSSDPDIIEEWGLTTAFDISTASVTTTVEPEANGKPQGVAFIDDGLRLVYLDNHNDELKNRILSPAFTLANSSASSRDETIPNNARGLFIRDNETDVYFCDTPNDQVEQWSISTPGDIRTASFVRAFATGLSVPRGVCFDPTGTIMMVSDNATDSIYQYNLSTGFDISTASANGNVLNTDADGGGETGPMGLAFDNEGSNLYVTGFKNYLTQFSL